MTSDTIGRPVSFLASSNKDHTWAHTLERVWKVRLSAATKNVAPAATPFATSMTCSGCSETRPAIDMKF